MLLVVVGLIVEDGEGAVELLNKKQAYHLMRQRHLRERNLLIGTGVYRFGKAVRTSHNKKQTAGTGGHALLQPRGKIHTAAFHTALVEQDDTVARLDAAEDESTLLLFLLRDGKGARLSQLRYHIGFEGGVMRETLAIFLY